MKMFHKDLAPLMGTQFQWNDDFWIADFRYTDINNKPIRHIPPTLVTIVENEGNLPPLKRVYYSDFHFRPRGKNGVVTAKIIAPFDNTGFRSNTGGSVGIFVDEAECREYYSMQCEAILDQIMKEKALAVSRFDKMLDEVTTNWKASQSSD
jgi:hypothetical protein